MAIRDICTDNVAMIEETATLSEAAQLMKKNNVGTLIVAERRKDKCKAVGLITDRDIALYLAENRDPRTIPVKRVMNRELITAQEGDGIFDVVRSMRKMRVNRMPVLDRKGFLKGIISSDDVLELLAAELSELAALRGKVRQRSANVKRPRSALNGLQ